MPVLVIDTFGGLNRSVFETRLGPTPEGMASARDLKNVVSDFREGALTSRRGLSRVKFGAAFTVDGRIDSIGSVTVAGKTRVFFVTSTGNLRRFLDPVRVLAESAT